MADAQYTFARSMDTSSAPYSEQPYPYDVSLNYGRSDYNVTDAFKIFGMWQPVFFHGSNDWMEKIAGGWSLSGIFNLALWIPVESVCERSRWKPLLPNLRLWGTVSGLPIWAVRAAAPASTRSSPQLVPTIRWPEQVRLKPGPISRRQPILRTTAPLIATGPRFLNPPECGRNSLTMPGYKDVDMTISKGFGLPNMPSTRREREARISSGRLQFV